MLEVASWPYVPKTYRKYFELDEYEPVIEPEEVKKKLSTKMQVKCERDCVCTKSFKELGPFDILSGTWKSACPSRTGNSCY